MNENHHQEKEETIIDSYLIHVDQFVIDCVFQGLEWKEVLNRRKMVQCQLIRLPVVC